jgi:hypothetical protein
MGKKAAGGSEERAKDTNVKLGYREQRNPGRE